MQQQQQEHQQIPPSTAASPNSLIAKRSWQESNKGQDEVTHQLLERKQQPSPAATAATAAAATTTTFKDHMESLNSSAGDSLAGGGEQTMDLESVGTLNTTTEEPDSLQQQQQQQQQQHEPDSLSYDEDTFAESNNAYYDSIGNGSKKLIIPYADSYSSDSFTTSQESLAGDQQHLSSDKDRSMLGDLREALMTPPRRLEEEETEEDSLLVPENKQVKKVGNSNSRPQSASSSAQQQQQQQRQWSSSNDLRQQHSRVLPHLPQQHNNSSSTANVLSGYPYNMPLYMSGRVAAAAGIRPQQAPALRTSSHLQQDASKITPATASSPSALQSPGPPGNSIHNQQQQQQQQHPQHHHHHHNPSPSLVRMATERLKRKFLGGN